MAELNINKLSIAHQKDKIIKIFDNPDECVKFAEKFEKEFSIKLSCDPLYAFLIQSRGRAELHGNASMYREMRY